MNEPGSAKVLDNRPVGFITVLVLQSVPCGVELCLGLGIDNLLLKLSHTIPFLLRESLLSVITKLARFLTPELETVGLNVLIDMPNTEKVVCLRKD